MKIACLIPGGLGGTQKAGWLFAQGMSHFGHEVTGFSAPGPSVPREAEPGLRIQLIKNDGDAISMLANERFDALHVHMPGYYINHPVYPFLRSLGNRRPRVIETNVFGRLQDWRANPLTDYRLFISMTSACQASNRAGKPLSSIANCSVARYPVFPAPVFSSGDRQRVRRELGFRDEDIVALRLGRPDSAKWSALECAATMQVRREGGKKLQLLVMEPPAALKQRIAAGEFGDGIAIQPVEASPTRVSALVDACDIIFHAARFGESFGYAIAEGMAAGKPVITRTTPYGDNAQTELVENDETGFVCSSLEGAISALRILVRDEALRFSMGVAGRKRIFMLSDPSGECEVLDAALRGDHKGLAARWKEIKNFESRFRFREWNVIESSRPKDVPQAAWVLAREQFVSRSMVLIKALGILRADLRSLFGRPSYR